MADEHAGSSRVMLRFGAFEVDFSTRDLRKNGYRVRLQEHPFTILATLLERPGEVVTREELRSRLWPDGAIVDFENGLNAAMGKLRQALRDSADKPRYIETVPRQGYRFIGSVLPPLRAPEQPEAPAEKFPRPRGGLFRALMFAAIGLGLLAIFYGVGLRSRPSPPLPMLVVLPFQLYDRNPGDQYLADGFTEEITAQLSRLEPKAMGVIARTTAMQYRPGTSSVAEIAEQLGVTYVLEGSVRRSSDRVRITAQLIRGSDQGHIWSGEYDRRLGDVLALEAEISQAVAQKIRVALSPETRFRLENVRPVNPRAYEAYLRGRYLLWSQEASADRLARASDFFHSAIDADRSYAPAYAGLAEYYLILPEVSRSHIEESLRQARELADDAARLDEGLAEAHMVLGAEATFTRDWARAGKEFQRALDLDPNLVRALALDAAYLLAIGRPADAIAQIRRAQLIDPLSLNLRVVEQRTLYLGRRYDETIAACKKRMELDPGSEGARRYLALTYAQLGRFPEALGLVQDGPGVSTDTKGYIYAVSGRRQEALRILEELRKAVGSDYAAPYEIALIYAGLGDSKEAMAWLEESEKLHDPRLSNRLLTDPKFDGLRSEPRFRAMVERMHYPKPG